MQRRQYLAAAGLAVGSSLVGCLDVAGTPGTGEPRGTETPPGNDTTESGAYFVVARLHNEDDSVHTFSVTLTDTDGRLLDEAERTVGPRTSHPLPVVGVHDAPRSFQVTVDDRLTSDPISFDVDPTPQKLDGIVEITRMRHGALDVGFTPMHPAYDATEVVDEAPRVDDPPYEIEEPDPPEGHSDGEWNDDYLGENQSTDPSLAFDPIDVPKGALLDPSFVAFSGSTYWVETITSPTARDLLVDREVLDDETRERLDGVDFDERLLVAVRTGYGSGSVSHRWSRIEATDEGLHLYGYYTDPYVQTADLTSWVSLLSVERPSGEATPARVSLTVDSDRRVHVNSTEGVVTVEHD